MGAIAFFGDKYGASVRVVQAGPTSLEFCGGTHVDSLGQIGPITLAVGGLHRLEHAADLRPDRQRVAGPGPRARAPGAVRRRAAAHGARRAAGRHRPPGGAPARGREGAGPAAPAVERGRGQGVGRGGRGRRRRGGGPPRQGGARRAADPGPGRPAPRRGARRRARRVARRDEGGHRGRHRRDARRQRSSCARSAPMVGGGGGGSAEVARRAGRTPPGSRRRWPRRSGFCPRERRRASGRGPGRVAALDLGARRIGVAYSDSGRTLASPWGTIERSGDPATGPHGRGGRRARGGGVDRRRRAAR